MDNQIIYGSLNNEQELKQKLALLAPSKFLNSNSIVDFERYKDIQIDWLDLLNIESTDKQIDLSFKDYGLLLGEYFQKYWDNKKSYQIFNTKKNEFPYVFNNTLLSDVRLLNKYWETAVVGYWSSNTSSVDFEKDVFCIIHNEAKRLYYFSNKKDEILTISDLNALFNTADILTLNIFQFWQKLGKEELQLNLNICFKKDETKSDTDNIKYGNSFFAKSSSIDRNLIFYREEFFRLDIEFSFIQRIKENFEIHPKDTVGADLPSKLDEIVRNYSNTLDQEQLNIAKKSYFEITNRSFELENLLDNIKNKIESNGIYKLNLVNGATIYESDGVTPVATITNVKRGDIVQYEQRTYTYSKVTSWRERVCTRRITFPTSPWSNGNVCVDFGYETRYRTDIVQESIGTPVKVELSDPLESFKKQIRNLSRNIKFYTCIKTNEGYICENDRVPLKQILNQCEADEDFRLNCVVIVYKYDFILSEKKYPVSAEIFFAPLPNMFNQTLPNLKLREILAYRIAWEGAELGQLVNSINLAPGESRQISLSTSFVQNTTKSSALKSTSETNNSNSFDLSSELQIEATKEMSKTDSFNANISGSYGGFVSGGASGSTTSNIKTFTRDMSKLAKKTSASINRKLVSEINEVSSQSITTNQTTSRTSNISNINQGATLNLMIYQINNRFKSGLFVDDIFLTLFKNEELILGSGLYDLSIKGFHNLRGYINEILDELDKILIKILDNDERILISEKLCHIIDKVIKKDYSADQNLLKISAFNYGVGQTFKDENERNEIISNLRKLYTNRNFGENKMDFQNKFLTFKVKFTESLREYDDIFKSKEIVGKNLFDTKELIEESYFTVNSGGFYIDSLVGLNPATESYSETMRNLEKEKVTDKNKEQKIKNQLLQIGLPYINKISNDFEKEKSIVHLSCRMKIKFFTLLFHSQNKIFKVYINNKSIKDCKIHLSKDRYFFTINWENNIPTIEELEKGLEVIYKSNIIKFIK